MRNAIFTGKVEKFACFADFYFDIAAFQGFRANRDAQRIADKVAILEFNACTFFSVVKKDIDARNFEFIVNFFGEFELRGVFCVDWNDNNLERSDIFIPNYILTL